MKGDIPKKSLSLAGELHWYHEHSSQLPDLSFYSKIRFIEFFKITHRLSRGCGSIHPRRRIPHPTRLNSDQPLIYCKDVKTICLYAFVESGQQAASSVVALKCLANLLLLETKARQYFVDEEYVAAAARKLTVSAAGPVHKSSF